MLSFSNLPDALSSFPISKTPFKRLTKAASATHERLHSPDRTCPSCVCAGG